MLCFGISDLGNTWTPSIMNSAEETLAVTDLVVGRTDCATVRIGGSTNLYVFTYFAFSDKYIPDTSAGNLFCTIK